MTKTIVLDTRIYPASAIKAAAREYSEIADVKVSYDGTAATVVFENIPTEYEEIIGFEFTNYALWKVRN